VVRHKEKGGKSFIYLFFFGRREGKGGRDEGMKEGREEGMKKIGQEK
jgi:hypothetical protein